jgi:ATP-dependent Lon protease
MADKDKDKKANPAAATPGTGGSGSGPPGAAALGPTAPGSLMSKEEIPQVLPILPLRNSVFFPGGVLPLAVGRAKTIALIKDAVRDDQVIGVVTQRRAEEEDPAAADLHNVGTVARVVKLLKMGEDNYSLVVQGLARFRVLDLVQEQPYLKARVEAIEDKASPDDVEIEALGINLKKLAREVIELMPELPAAATELVESITHPGHLADLIAANVDVPIEEKQAVLETIDLKARMKLVLELLNRKREILKLSSKIDSQVKGEMSKTQREYYLRQQLKAIKEELGEMGEEEEELDELGEKIKKAGMPPDVEKVAQKELNRLKTIPSASSEYTVARTYLDWITEVPWSKKTEDNLDLNNAKAILNADHYDLEKVKKRILEYLAVRQLKADMKGPILCFVGPPGVGKTSLGQSIARAIGRKFVRLSLGGVRDEAEIRGHRRTYVGALPGRLIQSMKKAGSVNPVVMLDEIDKLGADFRGDPSAALLEVLDPEQNNSFSDHYLDVPYDLSRVLFIATANLLDPVPPALRDRMEILELPGYTFEEKVHIAREHLIPKELREHGLDPDQVIFPEEVLIKVIMSYTREAGVRNLERRIADICRAIAVDVASGKKEKRTITDTDVEEMLGAEKFWSEVAERTEVPGVATGMAWTAAGGDLLFIEATKMPGKGSLTLTGQLGDVMKESAQAALSYMRSKAEAFGVPANFLEKQDIHIHFPAGAIPKDGPSAGVTIFTALTSLLTGVRVRGDVSMTGEVTLRGLVLPVGGIKEKVLAAHRAGIKRIILPERNRKDLVDVPEQAKKDVEFVFASTMDDVLNAALEGPPFSKPAAPGGEGEGGEEGGKKKKTPPPVEGEVRA